MLFYLLFDPQGQCTPAQSRIKGYTIVIFINNLHKERYDIPHLSDMVENQDVSLTNEIGIYK